MLIMRFKKDDFPAGFPEAIRDSFLAQIQHGYMMDFIFGHQPEPERTARLFDCDREKICREFGVEYERA